MLEKIKATIKKPISKMLYFNILSAITNLEKPNTLIANISKNIITNPLEAPLISALLNDIWEDIQIAKNKNNRK